MNLQSAVRSCCVAGIDKSHTELCLYEKVDAALGLYANGVDYAEYMEVPLTNGTSLPPA